MITRLGRATAIVLIGTVGCSATPGTGSTSAATATSPSPALPSGTAPPTLVGTWNGVHDCQRIVTMLHDAGMDAQILENVIGNGLVPGVDEPADVADPTNPRDGAVQQAHSHFFLADGTFGSRDQHGQQVDDGRWSLVDGDTFAIGDVQFDFAVRGTELRMEPVAVGNCLGDPNEWCKEAWKLMVAMPGMAWIRGE